MHRITATSALTHAACVVLRTAETVTATLHRDGTTLVAHVFTADGVTTLAWPTDPVLDAMLTPGTAYDVGRAAVLLDEATGDVLVTLDGPDGDLWLAVPGAAVRAALTR
ncbi:hypothetical protein ACFUMH_13900 [Cellulomonas sp. NPDC057328]|uniref:hypothetical protein n=1 Tax=Cellulomonas sp. NPDC057328 TaxID=3346101 RepID=UPI00362BD389